jgi:hypothetical protein
MNYWWIGLLLGRAVIAGGADVTVGKAPEDHSGEVGTTKAQTTKVETTVVKGLREALGRRSKEVVNACLADEDLKPKLDVLSQLETKITQEVKPEGADTEETATLKSLAATVHSLVAALSDPKQATNKKKHCALMAKALGIGADNDGKKAQNLDTSLALSAALASLATGVNGSGPANRGAQEPPRLAPATPSHAAGTVPPNFYRGINSGGHAVNPHRGGPQGGIVPPSDFGLGPGYNPEWAGQPSVNRRVPPDLDPKKQLKPGEKIPASHMITDYGRPVFNQQNSGRCLEFASTSVFEHLANERRAQCARLLGVKNYNEVDLSEWFLANNGREMTSTWNRFTSTPDLFKEYGQAGQYGISDFDHETIFSRPGMSHWDAGGMDQSELDAIKYSLMKYDSPVLFVYKPSDVNWWHANSCYGFDDNYDGGAFGKGALICRDSAFGESTNGGTHRDFYMMPYSLALRSGKHASVQHLTEKPDKAKCQSLARAGKLGSTFTAVSGN